MQKSKRAFFFFALFFSCMFLSSVSLLAATCNVTTNADSGVGSLRYCIGNASEGDNIVIPATSTIGGDITLTTGDIEILKSITIQGASASTSIISSDGNDRIFTLGNSGTPVYVAVQIAGVTIQNGDNVVIGGGIIVNTGSSLILENSILSNNNASLAGGAIYSSGFLTIIGSTISNNSAGSGDGGGGMNCNEGTAVIVDSIISSNTTTGTGGGIYNYQCSVTIQGTGSGTCQIIGNQTTTNGNGGGVSNNASGVTLIDNCLISENTVKGTGNGGGIFNKTDGTYEGYIKILNSEISNNSTEAGQGQSGGAIYNSGIMDVESSNIHNNTADGGGGGVISVQQININNSTIASNIATTGDAGGISIAGKPSIITNSTISNNQANGTSHNAGGIYISYATTLSNVTIFGNSATGSGGGIYADSNIVHLNNVTIANNIADSDADNTGNGGGIYLNAVSLGFANTLIANNQDLSPAGAVDADCSTTVANSQMNSEGNNLVETVNADCVISGLTSTDITGQDPQLDPAGLQPNGSSGPYTVALLSTSVALNAANSLTSESTDERGIARPQGSAPDIGAYELVNNTLSGGCSLSNRESSPSYFSFIILALFLMSGWRIKLKKTN